MIIFVFIGVRSDVAFSALGLVTCALGIVLAIIGARSSPDETVMKRAENTGRWGRIAPEQITVRRFLIWIAIAATLIALFIWYFTSLPPSSVAP